MRNDARNWTAPTVGDWSITAPGVRAQKIDVVRQTIVSGVHALTHFDDLAGPAIGWPDIAKGTSYVVALRRDRALIVGSPVLEDGWHAASGLAISDMSGGYSVFELHGPATQDVLKRGADVSTNHPSKSAARRFGGLNVVLYQFEETDRVRLHVQRAFSETLQHILASYLSQIE